MIKNNRFFIDQAINKPEQDTGLNNLLAQHIKQKTQPDNSANQGTLLSFQKPASNSNGGTVDSSTSSLGESEGSSLLGDIAGLGSQGYSIYNGLSSGSGGGGMGYIGIGMNALNGLNKGISDANDPDEEKFLGGFGNGVQGFFGVDDSNDSEIMQSLKGTANGAMMGSSFGPWGALIGAVLGLGSSFIDDI